MSSPQIRDKGQEYQYVTPIRQSPGGHEIMMYDTPGDKKIIIRHASGSGIEFTNDGSLIFTVLGDVQFRSSRSDESEKTLKKVDKDESSETMGVVRIKGSTIELEAQDSFGIYSGGDLTIKGNNSVVKGKENLSLESAKSLYIDTQELRERSVSRQQEVGSMEGPGGTGISPTGGNNEINVQGNTIIKNNDPKGGITLQSAGYLNIVCGAERVDVTGNPAVAASALASTATAGVVNPYFAMLEGRATYTHNVYPHPGPTPAPGQLLPPGSAVFQTPGGYYHLCGFKYQLDVLGLRLENTAGLYNRNTTTSETINVSGPYKLNALPILLN